MRIAIHHETVYRYKSPASYSIQYLRLTPRSTQHQKVLSWKLDLPGAARPWVDAFGNQAHVLVINGAHEEILLHARGEVELNGTAAPNDHAEPHPPDIYLRPTKLTQISVPLAHFAEGFRTEIDGDRAAGLEVLMRAIRDTIDYKPGTTHAATAAGEAFAHKVGVCQDHAHVFLACCRRLGVPARYVSGYLGADAKGSMASHAWAEAFCPGEGWRGFDVANSTTRLERHVEVAIGLDYLDACPVRGIRRGGFGESLEVEVRVSAAAQAHQ
jgi:transglutaminase-like putative cysteine protease